MRVQSMSAGTLACPTFETKYLKVTQSLKPAVACILLTLLFLILVPASAQRKSDLASGSFSHTPYRVGERLTYNVSFSNFISAAHVELRVMARGSFFGREAIQLRGHVQTTGLINVALFAINNDYVTYVDPETGVPFRAQQIVREPGQTANTSDEFQPASGTYDFLSALYRVRALSLTEGSSYPLVVRSDNRDYQVELKVVGRQTIKTNAGSYNSLVAHVKVKNDINLDDIRICFSDDERRIPVLFTARHRAGEIRAELAGSEFVTTPAPSVSPTPAPQPTRTTPTPTVPGPAPSATLEGMPFNVGEQLNYQMFLGSVPQVAATASFHVRARGRYFEHDGLFLNLRAQTTNAIQRIFFASDQISSYVDPTTLLPFRTEMNLVEGRHRLNQVLTINQNHGSAATDKGERIEIPVGTHDYLSFFYALRTFNLNPPKRNAISLLVENKPKTLFISALRRETIKLGNQEIPAIQLSLTTDDPQADKFQIRAWVSADSRRLPLRLTAQTPVGQVRADLAIIPLTSQ